MGGIVANGRETEEPEVCRICFDAVTAGSPLISPCGCTGTIGGVHARCLNTWITTSGKTRCELCKTAYKIRIQPTEEGKKQQPRGHIEDDEQRDYKKWIIIHCLVTLLFISVTAELVVAVAAPLRGRKLPLVLLLRVILCAFILTCSIVIYFRGARAAYSYYFRKLTAAIDWELAAEILAEMPEVRV